MQPSSVSVIVVSYNTADQLCQCLSAIEPEHEIIVVDNASTDDSSSRVRALFPHVAWIQNEANKGFGAANNQGLAKATRQNVLLLNSDAYASPGAISLLAKQLDDASVAAVGGKLTYPDGHLQMSTAKRLSLWHVWTEQTFLSRLSGYWTTDPEWSTPVEVDQVMGACLMMRRGSAQFDERFFLYCEDSDLCLRLQMLGKIIYEPRAVFVHELGSSSSKEPWRGIIWYNRSKELYFGIHHGRISAALCFIFNRNGALMRLLIWPITTLLQFLLKKRTTPWKTWWMVLSAPISQGARRR